MPTRSPVVLILAALLAGISPASMPARAQAPSDTTSRPLLTGNAATLLKGGEMGELLAVFVPRGEAEVQRLLDDARRAEQSAAAEIESTRRLATNADDRARIMKEELETTRVRWEVARREQNQPATNELDATYRRQSRERQYLEQMREALRADADRLEAERAAATARVKALELELKVAQSNAQLSAAPTAEAMAQYRELLRDMLVADGQAADRGRDAADKRRLVADKRLRQLDALERLSAAPRR